MFAARALGSALLLAPWIAAQVPELEPPREILAAGKPIDVETGYAAPFLIDWNGDGLDDLLVGQFGYGKMHIYENIGTGTAPRYGDFRWFRAGGTSGRVPTG